MCVCVSFVRIRTRVFRGKSFSGEEEGHRNVCVCFFPCKETQEKEKKRVRDEVASGKCVTIRHGTLLHIQKVSQCIYHYYLIIFFFQDRKKKKCFTISIVRHSVVVVVKHSLIARVRLS